SSHLRRPTLTPLHFAPARASARTAAQPPPLSPVLLPFPSLFPRRSPSLSLSSLLPLVSPANGSGTQLLRQSPASSGQQKLGRRRTTGEIFLSPSSQLLHSPASKAVAATKRTSSEQLRLSEKLRRGSRFWNFAQDGSRQIRPDS
ncbi:hypothetical protein H5410_024588, partial [Solanum commersonii]